MKTQKPKMIWERKGLFQLTSIRSHSVTEGMRRTHTGKRRTHTMKDSHRKEGVTC